MNKKIIIFIILTFTTIMLLKLMKIGSLLGALAVPFTQNSFEARPTTITVTAAKTLYDFKMKSLDGKDVDLSVYKGKKVVILNTASKCGFTKQYADWEKYYEGNKDCPRKSV